jgi:hypothetical protein
MSTDLLSLVYQYRTLLGRRQVLRQSLSDDQEGRLQALELLFGWSSGAPSRGGVGRERRRMSRCPVAIAALVEFGGQLAPCTIVDLSGEGLSLERAPLTLPGESITVLVQDLHTGLEYRLPAEVCWRKHATLGARFDGLPLLIRHRRPHAPHANAA